MYHDRKPLGEKSRQQGDDGQRLLSHPDGMVDVNLEGGRAGRGRLSRACGGWKEAIIRAVIAVVFLCAGVAFGSWQTDRRLQAESVRAFGIDPSKIAVPRHIFTERKEVAFRPFHEFMGPGDEQDRNWFKITEGMSEVPIIREQPPN